MLQILGRSPGHSFDEPLGLLSDCHRRIECFLDVLIRIARKFEGCALTAEAENALQTARRYFSQAAPLHSADEEESLFPRMKAADAPGQICETIKRLESDHEEAGTLHARADALLEQWLNKGFLGPPESGELLALFEKLQVLYLAHIRTEDREVLPLATELLSEDALAAIGREMQARRGIAAADS